MEIATIGILSKGAIRRVDLLDESVETIHEQYIRHHLLHNGSDSWDYDLNCPVQKPTG